MILILLTVTLAGLKFFEFSFMENVSWWWVTGSFFLTFIWFEVFERLLGFDKKKLHEKFDAIQKRRAQKTFNEKK
jgi:small Trp-rich protein